MDILRYVGMNSIKMATRRAVKFEHAGVISRVLENPAALIFGVSLTVHLSLTFVLPHPVYRTATYRE
jgi:hypothetical protein